MQILICKKHISFFRQRAKCFQSCRGWNPAFFPHFKPHWAKTLKKLYLHASNLDFVTLLRPFVLGLPECLVLFLHKIGISLFPRTSKSLEVLVPLILVYLSTTIKRVSDIGYDTPVGYKGSLSTLIALIIDKVTLLAVRRAGANVDCMAHKISM